MNEATTQMSNHHSNFAEKSTDFPRGFTNLRQFFFLRVTRKVHFEFVCSIEKRHSQF